MVRIKDSVILITGASCGIGKALSIELARQGAKVVLGARSMGKLKGLEQELKKQGYHAEAVRLDVCSESSIRDVIGYIKKAYNGLDVLVNNAGIGLFETVEDSNVGDAKKVFDTNFFGPMLCMQNVLPIMQEGGGGTIVNISSAISKHASFYQGVYSASKSALDRLSEAVNIEERGNNIRVVSLFVDRTKTNFTDHVVGPKGKLVLPFKGLKSASPKDVAKKIAKAIRSGKPIVHTTLKSRIFSMAAGTYPSLIMRLFAKQYARVKK